MKNKSLLALLVSVCLSQFSHAYTFTSADGSKSIDAEILRRPTGETVEIKRADGIIMVVQNNVFSNKDSQYIGKFPIEKILTQEDIDKLISQIPEMKYEKPLPNNYESVKRFFEEYKKEVGFFSIQNYKSRISFMKIKMRRDREQYSPLVNNKYELPGFYSEGSSNWKGVLAAKSIMNWLDELDKYLKKLE